LKDAANIATKVGNLPFWKVAYVSAGFEDTALIGVFLAKQQAEKSGLSRTGSSNKKDELSFFYVERDVLESGSSVFVGLGHIVEANHGNTPSGFLVVVRRTGTVTYLF
jgi:hypothetical protein